jgi:hypothetical protein
VFASDFRSAIDGDSDETLYIEISADRDADSMDREQWRKANPSYPHRTPERADAADVEEPVSGVVSPRSLRASYYDGKRAIRQVGTIIPPQYYRLAIVLGWSAKAVDTLARRCNLDSVRVARRRPGVARLRTCGTATTSTSEVSSGIISSLIHGVSFLSTRGRRVCG